MEQKNWTHVQHLLGYERIDNAALIKEMNSLYANEWSLLQNFFIPTTKLKEKIRICGKYQRKYEKQATPYQRILASDAIDQATKDALRAQHGKLNPFALKQQIEAKLKHIFKQVSVTSNVRKRLWRFGYLFF